MLPKKNKSNCELLKFSWIKINFCFVLYREPRILHRTLQCSLLNGGVFCLSIFAFNGIVLPLIEALLTFSFSFGGQLNAAQWVWSWTSPVLSATFSTLWILPLFVLSKCVNCFWFQVCLVGLKLNNFRFINLFSGYRWCCLQILERKASAVTKHQQNDCRYAF